MLTSTRQATEINQVTPVQLTLATNNEDKIREIKHLLDDLPVTVLTGALSYPSENNLTDVENLILLPLRGRRNSVGRVADL